MGMLVALVASRHAPRCPPPRWSHWIVSLLRDALPRYIPLTIASVRGVSVHFTLAVAAAAASASLIAFPLAAQQATTTRAIANASNVGALNEVLVTARRREENIQDVPAAVSAISGAQLDASYTVSPQEISLLVPSLYYNSANPRNTAYTIRGLGSN